MRSARLSVEVSVELPRLKSPARALPSASTTRSPDSGEDRPTKSPIRLPWPEASPRASGAGSGSESRSPTRATGTGSESPVRPGGFEHVVDALERVVDVPIERINTPRKPPPEPAPTTERTRTPARSTPARDPSPGFDLTPLPTTLPPGFSREPTPASVTSDDDPPPKSGLRLPVHHTPQRRPAQPPINGPIYVPADVFAVLTSPIAPLPSATDSSPHTALPPPLPTVAGHALRSLVPPVPKPMPPRPDAW